MSGREETVIKKISHKIIDWVAKKHRAIRNVCKRALKNIGFTKKKRPKERN